MCNVGFLLDRTVRQNKRKKLTYRPSLAEIYEQFRGMKPASLKLQPGPHAGLGVPQYVQITSPIRRYQDLVLHNQLRGYVQRGSPPLRAQALLELFSELEDLNRSNNRAMRNARSYWSLRHYAHQLGNEVEEVKVSGVDDELEELRRSIDNL